MGIIGFSDGFLKSVLVHDLCFEEQKLGYSTMNGYEFESNTILFHCYCR